MLLAWWWRSPTGAVSGQFSSRHTCTWNLKCSLLNGSVYSYKWVRRSCHCVVALCTTRVWNLRVKTAQYKRKMAQMSQCSKFSFGEFWRPPSGVQLRHWLTSWCAVLPHANSAAVLSCTPAVWKKKIILFVLFSDWSNITNLGYGLSFSISLYLCKLSFGMWGFLKELKWYWIYLTAKTDVIWVSGQYLSTCPLFYCLLFWSGTSL